MADPIFSMTRIKSILAGDVLKWLNGFFIKGRFDSNDNLIALVNPRTGADISIGSGSSSAPQFLYGRGVPDNSLGANSDTYFDIAGVQLYRKTAGAWAATNNQITTQNGDRLPYLGPVCLGKYNGGAVAVSAMGFLSTRLKMRGPLQDDVVGGFWLYMMGYGLQETANAGTANIELSVDKIDGSRSRVSFDGGNNIGVAPTQGLYSSDYWDAGETRKRGETLTLNQYFTPNSAGTYGYSQRQNQYIAGNLDICEGPVSPAPTNRVMAGVPTSGGQTGYDHMPIAFLALTKRDTFLLITDSLNANDTTIPQSTDYRGLQGILRYLMKRYGCINAGANGDSYSSLETGNRFLTRTKLGQFVSAVVDNIGTNDANLIEAQIAVKFANMKARYPGKPYIRATIMPKVDQYSGAFYTDLASETPTTNSTNNVGINQGIRAGKYSDGHVDVATAYAPIKDSPKVRVDGQPAGVPASVTVSGLTNNTIVADAGAGAFPTDLLYQTILVKNVAGTTAGPRYVTSVSADGSTITVRGQSGSSLAVAAGYTVLMKPITLDGLHPCSRGEDIIEKETDWSYIDNTFK